MTARNLLAGCILACYRLAMAGKKGGADPKPESWADKLKRARAERGLSQRDLAEKSGISNVTIARIELGQNEPQGETARKLLEALAKVPKLPEV